MSVTNKETKVEVGASKEAAPAKRGGYRGNRYKSAMTTVVREKSLVGNAIALVASYTTAPMGNNQIVSTS
jgi:hypothetical protein